MDSSARSFGITLVGLSLVAAVSCEKDHPFDREVASQICSAAIVKLAEIDGQIIDVYASSMSLKEKEQQKLILEERKKPWSKDLEEYNCEALASVPLAESVPLTTEPATTDFMTTDSMIMTTDFMTTDVLPAGDPAETREKSKSWIAWLRGQGVVSAPRAETSPPEKTAKQSGASRSLDPCFTLPAKFSVENAEPDKEVPWLLPGALWDIASDGTAVDRVGRRTGQATLTDVGGGASVLRITWRWEDDSWEGQDVVSWLNREVNPRPGECALAGRGYSQVDRTQARYRHSRVDVTFQHID